MSSNPEPDPRRYDRAEVIRARLLPELVFDASEGNPVPPGTSEAVVQRAIILPIQEFDMANPADSAAPSPSNPTVVMTLSASNGHDPAALSNDLNQLRVAVRQYAAQQGPAEAVADALKRCLEDGIKLSVE
jgi:hypothetical protein